MSDLFSEHAALRIMCTKTTNQSPCALRFLRIYKIPNDSNSKSNPNSSRDFHQ